MLFRIVILCLILAGGYALHEIVSVRNLYYQLRHPLAPFTVRETTGGRPAVTIVNFMNYDCDFCLHTHGLMMQLVRENPNIRYVLRPVPYAQGHAETAAEMALAAGLQGKFWEMDQALAARKGPLDEAFFKNAAAKNNIDFVRLKREAEEKTVQAMAGENATASLRAGLQSTPAFIIGKTLYQPEKPLTLADLTRMVRAETGEQSPKPETTAK